MKAIYIFAFILSSVSVWSQVGIGTTTPHTSAALEVSTSSLVSKKGFLLPRINLSGNQDITTIPNPVAGMTVFNMTTAGSGSNQILGPRLSVYNGNSWQTISNLEEIRLLKIPTEFIIHSEEVQNFASDGSLVNVNAGVVEEVKWLPTEIVVDNPNDISYSNNVFTVLNSSLFQFSGSVNFRGDINMTDNSQIILALQKSTDGTNWTDFYSISVPLELQIGNKSQTIPIPRFIHSLQQNDKIRMVLYKPASKTNFGAGSGIMVNVLGDQTKSFRITTIPQ